MTPDSPRPMPRYLYSVPRGPVPAPDVVVHNILPTTPHARLGPNGFHAWLDVPSDRIQVCTCGWAPQLGVHYRVRRPA
jgi:hypothetical protein